MSADYRQEVLNVILAQLLQDRGIVSVPEGIIKSIDNRRRMPDVMVDFLGLRMMIEGEVSDQRDAEERALRSAQRRVEEGLAHIGLAVIYPEFLRRVPFEQLKDKLENGPIKLATTSESGISGFTSGNVNHLIDILYKTYEQLAQEDVVGQAVAIIDAAVEKAAIALRHSPAFPEEASLILGIRELPIKKKKVEDDENDD